MEYQLNIMDFILGNPIKISQNVSVKNVKVSDVVNDTEYALFTNVFCIGSRELFSQLREVDELEQRYPTVFEMMFDETGEGEQLLGSMLGIPLTTSALVINGLSYWTGLNADGFQKLTNRKIVHEEADWIIDKNEFTAFCSVIRKLTCYKPNTDFIAPKNMSDARYKIWIKHLKNRIKNASKQKNSTIADKILIFQINSNSYIPVEEILNMSFFYFNKLFEGMNEKEIYLRNWDVMVSYKYDTSKQTIKHWTEKFSV